MIDWTRSMRQTFEFYTVDPSSWGDKKKISNVIKSVITRDLEAETLGSATITCDDDHSDEYVRAYLIATQDGINYRFPLGTHIYQTPQMDYDGTHSVMDQEGYTPLIELKEKTPPLGYAVLKGSNILEAAVAMTRSNIRAPFVKQYSSDNMANDFVANIDDNYLTYVSDLLAHAGFLLDVDARGYVSFKKYQDAGKLQPVWTYTDDNSSILLPDISIKRDIYGIPNVVEVLYSLGEEGYIFSSVKNENADSIVSTVRRGREVVYRETDPDVPDGINQALLDSYARNLLKTMSTIEYEVTYTHGYCPVNIGDCVRLNYRRAGLSGINAKVIRQVIKCETSCQVEETAVYTKSFWE